MYYLNAVQEAGGGGIFGIFSGLTKAVTGFWTSLIKNVMILIFVIVGLLILAGILFLLKLKKKLKPKGGKAAKTTKKGLAAAVEHNQSPTKTTSPTAQKLISTEETTSGTPVAVDFDKS